MSMYVHQLILQQERIESLLLEGLNSVGKPELFLPVLLLVLSMLLVLTSAVARR